MIENDDQKRTALCLRRLIVKADISNSDRLLAERCLRRIEHPLRLTLFGTDPKHAISLLNLLIGRSVISSALPKARVQFFYGEIPHARLLFTDGTQETVEGSDFQKFFTDKLSKIRIYVDLPVLKKLSIVVATGRDPALLCSDEEKTLGSADIILWTGAELDDSMRAIWDLLPDRLRDHSYLVPSPNMDLASWQDIEQDFVDVIPVDPRRAQEAKNREGGVDKMTFKDSGGAQIVKTIKKEIDLLVRSAFDGGEVLLARFADELSEIDEDPTIAEACADPEAEQQPVDTADTSSADMPIPEPEINDNNDRVKSASSDDRPYSMPLGKQASRSRLLSSAGQNSPAAEPQRTVSQAIKNMPKKVSPAASKSLAKRRVRSRRSGPGATPWSLGL
ncbi:hypothetical protein N9L47_07950 [Rhodobacteraceae bacterium]|nr:hypothetical protein [Paracoccaceae bacterium]